MKNIIFAAFAAAFLLGLTGCSTRAVQNPQPKTFIPYSGWDPEVSALPIPEVMSESDRHKSSLDQGKSAPEKKNNDKQSSDKKKKKKKKK